MGFTWEDLKQETQLTSRETSDVLLVGGPYSCPQRQEPELFSMSLLFQMKLSVSNEVPMSGYVANMAYRLHVPQELFITLYDNP